MTHLSTYQRLALSEQHALSLRKYASRKLRAWEQAIDEQASERLAIEGAMRHEGAEARHGTCRGMVNAESAAQSATERPHVPDSHDARPGSARAAERPYSERTFRTDVRQGRPPAARCGDCVTNRVPLWAVSLPAEQQRALATAARLFAHPSDERDEKQRTMRQRRGDEAALATARKQALATTHDEAHRR